MKATIKLGRIGGVEVGANWTVLVIVALAAWALAAGALPELVEGQSDLAYATAGLAGALGLMLSILVHELSHAVVARHDGVPVERITLWMLGGVAELGGHARTPQSELRIAIAGPLTSLAVGAVSIVAAAVSAVAGLPELVVAVLSWLGLVNIVLAVFNLLPGAPLDGGRVLSAILWRRSGDEYLARWRSARAGGVLGQVLIGLGLLLLALFGRVDGLWLALIGWFVMSSAKAEETAAEMTTAFGDLRVGDVMTHDLEIAAGHRPIADFVEHELASTHVGTFPLVGAEGEAVGVLTLSQVRQVPRSSWATTTLQQAATPASRMTVAHPDDRLIDVLVGATSGDGRIVVTDADGALVGLVTPRDITTAFERRSLTRRPMSTDRDGPWARSA